MESVKGPTSNSGTKGRAVWVVSHLLWDLYSLRSERRQLFGLPDDVTHSWGQVSMTVWTYAVRTLSGTVKTHGGTACIWPPLHEVSKLGGYGCVPSAAISVRSDVSYG